MKKNMWKWKRVVVMLLWCLVGTIAFGMDEANAEVYGDYEYQILKDNTVEISRYNGSKAVIEIPSEIDGKNVTSIGYGAFGGSNLSSVTIPEGITTVKDEAFWCCSSLGSIIIPSSVVSIEEGAFGCCSSLNANSNPPAMLGRME